MYTVAAAIALVLLIAMVFGFEPPFVVRVSLPMQFNVEELGILNLANTEGSVSIQQANGKLQFQNTPGSIRVYFSILMAGMLVIVFGGLWYLRKFIKAIHRGDFFSSANVVFLKRFAYLLVALWIYGAVMSIWLNSLIHQALIFETVSFTQSYDIGIGLPIFALFIWVLSHIFSAGATMREEQEYTI